MGAVQAAPPRPLEHPRVVAVGTAFASVAVAMFFAGLLGTYLIMRAQTLSLAEAWLQDVVIPLQPPNMMMVTLLLSCVSMQWAFWAVARNDRVNAYVALGLTLLLGAAVLNAQYWMYRQMSLGIGDSIQAVLIYAITASFLALLVSAMVYLTAITFRTLGGQYGPHQHGGVAGAAMFWYVTVAVFAVIWYAVYITK